MTDDVQRSTQQLLDDLVGSGAELGLQVAAYHHGALVVDAWAGIADPATGTPVDRDTLFTVYSVSKGITATAVHILAERGTLAYEDPIARHWPEFGRHGKAGIHLRHALSHTAGLPQMPPGYGSYEVTDWSAMCDRIATPLALNGLYFGVPASELSRVATLVEAPEPPGAAWPEPRIPDIVPDEA